MTKIIANIATIVVISFFLTGCGSKAMQSAAAGGAAGAGIGQWIGGNTESTLIGAAIGTVGGYFFGNEWDKRGHQQLHMQQQRTYYPPPPQYRPPQRQQQYYDPQRGY